MLALYIYSRSHFSAPSQSLLRGRSQTHSVTGEKQIGSLTVSTFSHVDTNPQATPFTLPHSSVFFALSALHTKANSITLSSGLALNLLTALFSQSIILALSIARTN